MDPRDRVASVLDCVISEREFELQLRGYVHFWNNSLRKEINPLIP